MSDSISLNSTNCGNNNSLIDHKQSNKLSATIEGKELTGPWTQLWVGFFY
jgi:hypothetical protein